MGMSTVFLARPASCTKGSWAGILGYSELVTVMEVVVVVVVVDVEAVVVVVDTPIVVVDVDEVVVVIVVVVVVVMEVVVVLELNVCSNTKVVDVGIAVVVVPTGSDPPAGRVVVVVVTHISTSG